MASIAIKKAFSYGDPKIRSVNEELVGERTVEVLESHRKSGDKSPHSIYVGLPPYRRDFQVTGRRC
jgi:hypothetical protein